MKNITNTKNSKKGGKEQEGSKIVKKNKTNKKKPRENKWPKPFI